MNTLPEQTIVLPMSRFLNLVLRDNDNVRIDPLTATTLLLIHKVEYAKNKSIPLYHVELEHPISGELYDEPRLWRYHYWVQSVERYQKAKRYSDNERKLRNIREYNISLLAEAIQATGVSEMAARCLAMSKIARLPAKAREIREIWEVTLVEREEDIPNL